jgi:hypothetical protein
MHILDLVRNSVEAHSTSIYLIVDEDITNNLLTIQITDNGRGMSPEKLKNVTDPFSTSRTTRNVGLGLSLLQQSAQMSGGELDIESTEGKGTCVTATFQLRHIDRPPFGDLPAAIGLSCLSYPDIDFSYRHTVNDNEFEISSDAIRKILGANISTTNSWYKEVKKLIAESLIKMGAAKIYPITTITN